MLPHAIVNVLLELGSDQFEVVVLLPTVLEVGNQGHEEGLVESPILLVLLDIESRLRARGILGLALRIVCCRLVGLLEHDDWLELAVQGPEHFLQAIDYFVVNEVLQLAKHFEPAFTLCELVQGGRHVLGFGSGCFLVPLTSMHAWIHYVSSNYADFFIDFVEEAPLFLDLLGGHLATEET